MKTSDLPNYIDKSAIISDRFYATHSKIYELFGEVAEVTYHVHSNIQRWHRTCITYMYYEKMV